MMISTTSSITRQRPNVITWVINIVDRFQTDKDNVMDLWSRFDAKSKGGLQAKLTQREKTAMETLLFGMDSESRQITLK